MACCPTNSYEGINCFFRRVSSLVTGRAKPGRVWESVGERFKKFGFVSTEMDLGFGEAAAVSRDLRSLHGSLASIDCTAQPPGLRRLFTLLVSYVPLACRGAIQAQTPVEQNQCVYRSLD